MAVTQRVPNEVRSARTRQRLLDAAVEVLLQRGWAGTSTSAIADRAGVSRGAQLHHYPTRADLVVSAAEHLFARRAEELVNAAEALPGDARLDALLDLLWEQFASPLFDVVVELWVAARTDADLRAELLPRERAIGRQMRELGARVLPDDVDPDRAAEVLDLTLHLLRGLAMQRLLAPARGAEHTLAAWRSAAHDLLVAPPTGQPTLDA